MAKSDRQSELENLLYHIVLPRVLPQQKSKNYEQHELALLSFIRNAVEDCSKWVPPHTMHLSRSLYQTHMIRTPENVSKEINALQPGDTFGMFVRRQNCALMIHMPIDGNGSKTNEEKTVIVTTFPGNLHPKEVYNCPSDIEVK